MTNILLKNEKGSILILTFVVLLALTSITIAFLHMTSIRAKDSGHDITSTLAFWITEAGVQYGVYAIKEDRTASAQMTDPASKGYCARVTFDGYEADEKDGDDEKRACFIMENPMLGDDDDDDYAKLDPEEGAYIEISDFQQRMNMVGTSIKGARIGMYARKGEEDGGKKKKGKGKSKSSSSPVVQLQYTLDDGDSGWIDVGGSISLSKTSWTMFYSDFDVLPAWKDIMDEKGFKIRALKTDSKSEADIEIDWLGLELVLKCDTLTEPWSTGSYASFPMMVGDGTIQSITITDESAKIHLNYASELLLRRIMEEVSISKASRKAKSIVNYRDDVGWFNTIEEIQQISDRVKLSEGDFDLLKDYITVYSWVNSEATAPDDKRAPININTASETVLRAIFKAIKPAIGKNRANRLAKEIVKDRVKTPFTHMNSSVDYYNKNTQTFAYYVETKSSILGSKKDRDDKVRENADSSENNIELDESWTGDDATTTEFCFYTSTFLITAVGQDGLIQRTIKSTCGESYDHANFLLASSETFELSTYVDEASPHAYWREVVEE